MKRMVQTAESITRARQNREAGKPEAEGGAS
jgi:hypothetical protein